METLDMDKLANLTDEQLKYVLKVMIALAVRDARSAS